MTALGLTTPSAATSLWGAGGVAGARSLAGFPSDNEEGALGARESSSEKGFSTGAASLAAVRSLTTPGV
jgi:hypothetical protein